MMRFYRPAWLLSAMVLLAPPAFPHADLDLQIENLSRQLQEQPDNVELLLKRGDLQRRHENFDLARSDFARVREIQPDNKIVDWFEGRVEVEAGRPEQGIKYLDRFLESGPDRSSSGYLIALQNRAQAHLLLDQPLLAAKDYQEVIRASDKPTPTLYSSGALALVEAGTEHFPDAMGLVQQGLSRFPGEVTLTGIGTDISLAMADIDTARGLIDTLPEPILGLPKWKARVALLDCLVAGNNNCATK